MTDYVCPICDKPDPSFFEAPFTNEFMTRTACGNWNKSWAVISEIANFHIAVASIIIATVILLTWIYSSNPNVQSYELSRKQKSLIISVYSAFIFLGGVSHFDTVLAFHTPMYHTFALVDLVTSLVSWAAVVVTVKYKTKLMIGVFSAY